VHHKQTTSTQSSGLFHAAMQSKRVSNNNVSNNGNIINCHSLDVIRWNYSTTHEATLISQHNCGRNRMILTNWNIGLEHRRCFDSPLGQRVGVRTFNFLWSIQDKHDGNGNPHYRCIAWRSEANHGHGWTRITLFTCHQNKIIHFELFLIQTR
jgi:hypothetical protein